MVSSVDNIDSKVLDKLKELYSNKDGYRIVDDREKEAFGRKREYFLIARVVSVKEPEDRFEFTFIWIGKNLWQYRYLNTRCTEKSNWITPSELLNNLLKEKV